MAHAGDRRKTHTLAVEFQRRMATLRFRKTVTLTGSYPCVLRCRRNCFSDLTSEFALYLQNM